MRPGRIIRFILAAVAGLFSGAIAAAFAGYYAGIILFLDRTSAAAKAWQSYGSLVIGLIVGAAIFAVIMLTGDDED